MPQPDLAAFFVPGSVYHWTDGTPVEVEVLDAGRLELTTGKVVATDPTWPTLDDAVAAVVQPGSYPVSLSVARSRSAPERALVSAVRMLVSEGPVESWAPAWPHLTSDGTARALGFTVDAGQACLLDQAALPFLIEFADVGEASNDLSLRVNREMFEHVVHEATGLNVIVFACGMGDGTYPVWSGSTRDGEHRWWWTWSSCLVVSVRRTIARDRKRPPVHHAEPGFSLTRLDATDRIAADEYVRLHRRSRCCYICSGADMPSRSSPWVRTSSVCAHNASRESRT